MRLANLTLVGLLCGLLCAACSATSTPPKPKSPASDQPEIPVEADGSIDLSGGPWRMIEVPAASNAPDIVRTPEGFLALSSRTLGDSKAPSGAENALYRSGDGVHWRAVPLPETDSATAAPGGSGQLQLRSLAYGDGHYVMVGRDQGLGMLWTSDDAEHWTQSMTGLDGPDVWGKVVFVHDRFFAFGSRVMGVSTDGERFTRVETSTVQINDAAYGKGRYLLVGSGPMQVSTDGLHFEARDVSCLFPGACIVDPSGGVHQGVEFHALFAEDRFYTDQLSSPDGVSWRAERDRFPAAYVSRHFFDDGGLELHAWVTDGAPHVVPVIRTTSASATAQGRALTSVGVLDRDAALPDEVDASFEDGLSCESASCVLIADRLYLVPPPGTPTLPDRVPRTADGEPLLSDDCPRSSMIFCDDYEVRSGCTCDPGAPAAPEACQDVSQFACAGSFEPRPDEWRLAEVAEGGCNCDAVDPNQPARFGLACDQDASVCQTPLSCLAVQAPPSIGVPFPQPMICTVTCAADADCPSWQATGFCAGEVQLRCVGGACQPRSCE